MNSVISVKETICTTPADAAKRVYFITRKSFSFCSGRIAHLLSFWVLFLLYARSRALSSGREGQGALVGGRGVPVGEIGRWNPFFLKKFRNG